ncbi:MAG: hypothetical protein IJ733_15800 [Lachnospiraceae bacterium]|nr:hypothetical protein [Lachnospiraceae bacterium]
MAMDIILREVGNSLTTTIPRDIIKSLNVKISNRLLNDRLTLAFLCPVTHTRRNNPFHYELTEYDFIDGFVMCNQLKTMFSMTFGRTG